MARNLDLTALRSFVAVAETGGVTKAAGFLHLTQSAVSMQLKRLEESLNTSLLDRSARQISLTAQGEQLLTYARRMLDLNDEIYGRLTCNTLEGELLLGVPHDLIYPAIPPVLNRFQKEFPRMRVQLVSSFTTMLKEDFRRGKLDMILTTEDGVEAGGETLTERELIWVGAPEGTAWKARPVKLAFEPRCIFRRYVQDALDQAGISWEIVIESESSRAVEASVSADLAIFAQLDGMWAPQLAPIAHGGALPPLTAKRINLYVKEVGASDALIGLGTHLRRAFQYTPPIQLRA